MAKQKEKQEKIEDNVNHQRIIDELNKEIIELKERASDLSERVELERNRRILLEQQIKGEMDILQSTITFQENSFVLNMSNLLPQSVAFRGELYKLHDAVKATIKNLSQRNNEDNQG